LNNKDEATREALASELGELKNKYFQLEQAYDKLKDPSQVQAQEQLEDTFYQEANLEGVSELGHS